MAGHLFQWECNWPAVPVFHQQHSEQPELPFRSLLEKLAGQWQSGSRQTPDWHCHFGVLQPMLLKMCQNLICLSQIQGDKGEYYQIISILAVETGNVSSGSDLTKSKSMSSAAKQLLFSQECHHFITKSIFTKLIVLIWFWRIWLHFSHGDLTPLKRNFRFNA